MGQEPWAPTVLLEAKGGELLLSTVHLSALGCLNARGRWHLNCAKHQCSVRCVLSARRRNVKTAAHLRCRSGNGKTGGSNPVELEVRLPRETAPLLLEEDRDAAPAREPEAGRVLSSPARARTPGRSNASHVLCLHAKTLQTTQPGPTKPTHVHTRINRPPRNDMDKPKNIILRGEQKPRHERILSV